MDTQTMVGVRRCGSRLVSPLVAAPAKFGSAPTYRGAGTRVASTDGMGTRGDPSTWTVPGGADGGFLDAELRLPRRDQDYAPIFMKASTDAQHIAVLRCTISLLPYDLFVF